MKKTPYQILVATKNGYPVYRTVYIDKGHYYIKYKNDIINVDEDIENHNYTRKDV